MSYSQYFQENRHDTEPSKGPYIHSFWSLGNATMADSPKKGDPNIDPKYHNPQYGDLQRGTHNLKENSHIDSSSCRV